MRLIISVLAILSFLTIAAFAQKVKEKENVYSIDDKPFSKKGCKNEYQDPCLFTSPSGEKKFFSLKPYSYQD